MIPGNPDGKASPGSPFRPPAARLWNGMVDAGRAHLDSLLDNESQQSNRARATDIIKVKNNSGAARRKGEILQIGGKAIFELSNENIWLNGGMPSEDCHFGILREPVLSTAIAPIQVSGCGMALVNITDVDHGRARTVDGEYVLASSDEGPLEILYAPDEHGEQNCVVRFGSNDRRLKVVYLEDLMAAVDIKTDPSFAWARVYKRKANGDLALSARQVHVVNRYKHISIDAGTTGNVEWLLGEWGPYTGDCDPESLESDSESSESG